MFSLYLLRVHKTIKKRGSPCSFRRKSPFLYRLSLASVKIRHFINVHARASAPANDAGNYAQSGWAIQNQGTTLNQKRSFLILFFPRYWKTDSRSPSIEILLLRHRDSLGALLFCLCIIPRPPCLKTLHHQMLRVQKEWAGLAHHDIGAVPPPFPSNYTGYLFTIVSFSKIQSYPGQSTPPQVH